MVVSIQSRNALVHLVHACELRQKGLSLKIAVKLLDKLKLLIFSGANLYTCSLVPFLIVLFVSIVFFTALQDC